MMGHWEYYSNGKLLITGEYFVLKGARSLALPLRLGQTLTIDNLNDEHGRIFWKSYYQGEVWFEAIFRRNTFGIVGTTNAGKAQYIQNLLQETARLNGQMFSDSVSVNITTTLGFHPDWGLGSSSSLISNLAAWTSTDPYLLLQNTTGGSGYDIACARSRGPILYSLVEGKPSAEPVLFQPSFRDSIYFVYLGNKVSSADSISKNAGLLEPSADVVSQINDITRQMAEVQTLPDFEKLIRTHEAITARALQTVAIQEQRFSDFAGSIKSLGAWGGDFIMAASSLGKDSVEAYFKNKGLPVMFMYKDLVL